MTDVLGTADDVLAARGALDIPHPGGTLLIHLRRVRELLASWGGSVELQAAGLCHAAYGTDGFTAAPFTLDERPVLRAVIGESSEALVYAYGSCARKLSYAQLAEATPEFTDRFTGTSYTPHALQLSAFLEITAANELDVMQHDAELAARWTDRMRALLSLKGELLSAGARAAWSLD